MIPSEHAHLRAYAISHPGMSGKNNEDRYAVSAFWTEGEHPLPVLFAVVSDGIGGHKAGEIAAEMVVETLSQDVAKSDGRNPVQTLREAIMRSSQEILVKAEADEEKYGMGATCACALVLGDQLFIAYVGDSPTFLIRNDAILKLSIDHTWVQEAVDAGVIEPEQAKTHPNAHVIRRYLGSKEPVLPDTRLRLTPNENDQRGKSNQGLPLRPRDRIIICSDGLTDLVDESEILNAFEDQNHDSAIKNLVNLANQRGGHDNITIVALSVPESLPEATQPITLSAEPEQKITSKTPNNIFLILLLIILIIAAGGIIYLTTSGLLFQKFPTPTTSEFITNQPTMTFAPQLTSTAELLEMNPKLTIEPPRKTTHQILTETIQSTMTPWPTNTFSP